MKKYYDIMGLSPDCSDTELDNKYWELRNKYSEDRFLDGEEGNIGAINLGNLEEAYKEIKRLRESSRYEDSFGSENILNDIDNLIKNGELDSAQSKLEGITDRNGRWHYLQSIIHYKRGWYNDSLQSLNIAVSLEPNNTQYQKSRDILQKNMNSVPPQNASYGTAPEYSDDSMGLTNCCSTLCCMSCLCDSLRCFGCG